MLDHKAKMLSHHETGTRKKISNKWEKDEIILTSLCSLYEKKKINLYMYNIPSQIRYKVVLFHTNEMKIQIQ